MRASRGRSAVAFPAWAPAPRLTLGELPPAARTIASATTSAIAATQDGDRAAFDDACTRLFLLADPEHAHVILGDTVRVLLEEVLPTEWTATTFGR